MSIELMELLASPENLLSAWRAVRSNIPRYRRARSSGPDGVSLEDFERNLHVELSALRHMLLKERYEPSPAAIFSVPKKTGGERQICLLTIRDRVAQRAAQQVIEPLWEPAFLDCSYGFRPNRSLQAAVADARRRREEGNRWVVDGDIQACFDCLDHEILRKLLSKRITDGRVIRLVDSWLNTGILQASVAGGNGDEQLLNRLQRAAKTATNGLDWAVSSTRGKNGPYQLPSQGAYDPEFGYEYSPYAGSLEVDGPYEEIHSIKDGLRRMAGELAASGLVIGMRWIRPAISSLGSSAVQWIRTPAARSLLQKGLLSIGGAAGIAAGAAVATYFLYRKLAPATTGVLQGSPLSPLLANIYLHHFDVPVTRAGYHLVRFADDWVIACPSLQEAEQAYNRAVVALSRLRLKLNPQKTRILRPDEPLDWLGEKVL